MKTLTSLALTVVVAACGTKTADEVIPWVETDSAGITIVDNRSEAAPTGWALSAAPSFAAGGMEAPESEQLFRVSGAVRLADGRIALGNAGTGEVLIIGVDGTTVARHGQKGDGPGEFQDLRLLGLVATDSLLVWDQDLRRASVLHVDQGYARSYQVEWTGAGFPIARGMLADGSIVIGGGMSFSGDGGMPTGMIRPTSTFGWVDPSGTEVHLADLVAAEMFARADEGGFMARSLPFGRFAVVAAGPDGAWLGMSDTYRIAYYDNSGNMRRIVRLDVVPERVTDADIERYIADAVAEEADTENRSRELRALIAEMPVPETFPAYRSLLVDSQGALWVEDYSADSGAPPAWTVFDGEGHILGRVEAPEHTRFVSVGADYVIGITRDDFDVESLTVWSLTRPARTASY